MRRWASAVIAVFISAIAPASGQRPAAPVVIEEDLRVEPPLGPCALPALASRIARSAHIPIGIEDVPESCNVSTRVPSKHANDILLQGLTVTQAFDILVHQDPRYAWTESDGVLVVRPLVASSDPSHYLHRTIPALNLVDQRLHGALGALVKELSTLPLNGADRYAATSPDGNRRFNVNLTATSVLEALNASVRAHGAMMWRVSYCQPVTTFEYATISFSTFDGSGLGVHMATRGEDGRTFDACRSPK